MELDSGKTKTITGPSVSLSSGCLIIFPPCCLVCNIYVFNNTRMVLTLGIHSRMGTVRGPSVIGCCLSPLQGGGCVWCLLDAGEGVGVLHPEDLGENVKSQSGQGGRWGEGKKRGGFCLFRFAQEDESWNKMFERLRCFSPVL